VRDAERQGGAHRGPALRRRLALGVPGAGELPGEELRVARAVGGTRAEVVRAEQRRAMRGDEDIARGARVTQRVAALLARGVRPVVDAPAWVVRIDEVQPLAIEGALGAARSRQSRYMPHWNACPQTGPRTIRAAFPEGRDGP
jgi:hypothetical protein